MKLKRKRHFSKRLQEYVYTIKLSERYEVYETVLLMFLNNDLITALEDLIDDCLKEVKTDKDGKTHFNIKTSKEYQEAVEKVCKSVYFKKNFSKYEIRRKHKIMEEVLKEVITKMILSKDEINPDDIPF